MDGMCLRCKEWTNAADSCCGAGVIHKGQVWSEQEAQEKLLIVGLENFKNDFSYIHPKGSNLVQLPKGSN